MLDRITRSITSRISPKVSSPPVVIAVTSPHGSTGKTTVAINIALELAAEKARVLLIDGDIQGPAVANHFALTQQPAGLQAALRIASQQRFDLEQLERLSFQFQRSTLRIMPGSQNFPSQPFDQESVANILETARSGYEFTVVDLGSLSADANGTQSELTNAIIALADRTIVVCLADPIGIFRLLGIENLIAASSKTVDLVMNRVRNSVIASARREIAITLQRLSTLEPKAYLPDDPQHIDQAVRTGVPATSLSRSGSFRQALTGYVRTELLGRKGALDSRVAKLG
ncbi:MAG: AAA family ATPase [Micrococcales bacterium]|nr:AAA family ATPase [Micrococcales bacterium]